MDEYRAKRDCYYEGHYLKKGEIIKVKKGTEVKFALLEKVGATVQPKK
ncbi:MAG: hypothetical protein ACQEWA_03185 [Sphaerochaetaceae bacterium]